MECMVNPLVSVCVPAYNREDLIEECLDSVLSDSYFPKELLIIDDGSTDRTASLVEWWASVHPQIPVHLIRQEHAGLVVTRNRLVEQARGELVAWLDTDDRLVEGGLAARVRYLAEHTEKMAVFGDAHVIDANGNRLFESVYDGVRRVCTRRFLSDAGMRYELITNWCLPGPVMMIRKSAYDVVGKEDPTIAAHDFDVCLRMLARNMVGFVPVVVCDYRLHSGNMSRETAHRVELLHSFRAAAWKSIGLFRFYERVLLCLVAVGATLKALLLSGSVFLRRTK